MVTRKKLDPEQEKVLAALDLKSLPQNQIGVTELGNIRTVKLAAPICPIRVGYSPDSPRFQPEYVGEINCSFRGPEGGKPWWTLCVSRNHDPYFTVNKVETSEDILDDEGYVVKTRKKVTETKQLNLVQVPLGLRYSSGKAVAASMMFKGRKPVTEFGYKELCEYRNCETDARLKTRYGKYCNERHARLIGSDAESLLVGVGTPKDVQRYEAELAELDLDYEGYEVMGTPYQQGQSAEPGTDAWMSAGNKDGE